MRVKNIRNIFMRLKRELRLYQDYCKRYALIGGYQSIFKQIKRELFIAFIPMVPVKPISQTKTKSTLLHAFCRQLIL
jgi:hypothetical protein